MCRLPSSAYLCPTQYSSGATSIHTGVISSGENEDGIVGVGQLGTTLDGDPVDQLVPLKRHSVEGRRQWRHRRRRRRRRRHRRRCRCSVELGKFEPPSKVFYV